MPILFIGTIDSFAKSPLNVKLTSHFDVTYCNDALPKTEVLVTVGIGEIIRSDSLYGFNFAIKYDRTKLYFNSKITSNTLTEFASYADVSFGLEYGKLFGAGINNTPLSGNKELIGFYGDYIGELCNDSALVEIEYIEFTDEFQKIVNRLDTIWIKPVKINQSYNLNINLSENYIEYDSNKTNVFPVEMSFDNVKYLDKIGLKVSSENEAYKLNYSNINTNFKLTEIERNPSSLVFTLDNMNNLKLTGNIKLFDVELSKINKNTDTNSFITISPIKLSDCNCFDYTRVTSDSILIKYVNEPTTDVVENIQNIEIKYFNNTLQLKSNYEAIKRIQLFNSVGNIIIDETINSEFYTMNYNLPKGVYFVLILTDKQFIKKKILLNN